MALSDEQKKEISDRVEKGENLRKVFESLDIPKEDRRAFRQETRESRESRQETRESRQETRKLRQEKEATQRVKQLDDRELDNRIEALTQRVDQMQRRLIRFTEEKASRQAAAKKDEAPKK